MADLTHNGKSQFMEPLSSRARLPEILLDRQSRESLHGQITRQVAKAIREGSLRRGCRLPSTRLLARMLGVSSGERTAELFFAGSEDPSGEGWHSIDLEETRRHAGGRQGVPARLHRYP
jgi:hypothetical protein